jgi:predicted TPR repeat methyltransferase
LQSSVDMLRKLISLKPELGALYSNLGIVLRRLNKLEEALDACQKAVDLSPTADTHLNLGNVAKGLRRFDEAAAAYQTAIALDPRLTDAYRPLVSVLRENGNRDELAGVLKQWQNVEPDNPIPRHMLAVYSGEDTPTRASDDYVRQVFNEFAATFDDDLSELDYRGPRLIGESLGAEPGEPVEGLDVLDAGCGTGLCGSLLRPLARRLIGVDLSDLMIQRAKELHVYDELVVTELTDFLTEHPLEFDLIVATDTFNYFGDLEPLLTAAVRSLRDAGLLIYTLEKCTSSESVTDYQLNPHGRYSHNRDYVKDCMKKCGLNISSMEDAILRKERNQNVNGIVVRCRKEAHHRTEGLDS